MSMVNFFRYILFNNIVRVRQLFFILHRISYQFLLLITSKLIINYHIYDQSKYDKYLKLLYSKVQDYKVLTYYGGKRVRIILNKNVSTMFCLILLKRTFGIFLYFEYFN